VNRYETSMMLVLSATAALLGAALFYEHVRGLDPCPLCLMQRIWFMVVGLVAFAALVDRPSRLVYPILIGISAVIGAGFSVRQLYLQQLPPGEAPACGPGLAYMIDVFPASEVLRTMVMGTGDCAAVSWSLLGLSMAGWALISFIAICATTALPWLRPAAPVRLQLERQVF
jgi:protein dithiol:quinone oxidoreductase